MTPQTGPQTIIIHVLSNISRSKHNQTMKFDQLIEDEMRNTFLEKIYKNVAEKVSPDIFIKNQN